MIEAWKAIDNGYYAVSNRGRVKRLKPGGGATVGRILRPGLNRRGYLQYRLTFDGRVKKSFLEHRLVAITFIGQCPQGLQINHRNGIKTDNRVENLEWVTPRENCLHAIKNGLFPINERSGMAKLKNTDIREIRNLNKKGISTRQISKKYNVSYENIRGILKGKTWSNIV